MLFPIPKQSEGYWILFKGIYYNAYPLACLINSLNNKEECLCVQIRGVSIGIVHWSYVLDVKNLSKGMIRCI